MQTLSLEKVRGFLANLFTLCYNALKMKMFIVHLLLTMNSTWCFPTLAPTISCWPIIPNSFSYRSR